MDTIIIGEIPPDVNPELSSILENLLEIILNLCQDRGYCWAQNAFLAERTHCTERTITTRIKQLSDAGYIIPYDCYGERHIKPGVPYPFYRFSTQTTEICEHTKDTIGTKETKGKDSFVYVKENKHEDTSDNPVLESHLEEYLKETFQAECGGATTLLDATGHAQQPNAPGASVDGNEGTIALREEAKRDADERSAGEAKGVSTSEECRDSDRGSCTQPEGLRSAGGSGCVSARRETTSQRSNGEHRGNAYADEVAANRATCHSETPNDAQGIISQGGENIDTEGDTESKRLVERVNGDTWQGDSNKGQLRERMGAGQPQEDTVERRRCDGNNRGRNHSPLANPAKERLIDTYGIERVRHAETYVKQEAAKGRRVTNAPGLITWLLENDRPMPLCDRTPEAIERRHEAVRIREAVPVAVMQGEKPDMAYLRGRLSGELSAAQV